MKGNAFRDKPWINGARLTLSYAGSIACLALLLGLGFHTSAHPVVFHKYSIVYTIFLVMVAVLSAAWWPICSFFFSTSTLRSTSGRSIAFRPRMKLVVYGALAILAGVAAEAVYRSRLPRPTISAQQGYHPYLQNVLYAGAGGDVNRHGFKGPEFTKQTSADTIRIFIVGGSSVLSSATPLAQCHSFLLQQKLSRHYPGLTFEVQNAGNHWHTTEHTIIKQLFDIRDFDPDLVIVWHAINDLCRSFAPYPFAYGEYRNDYGHFYGATAPMVYEHFQGDGQGLVEFSVNMLWVQRLGRYVGDAWFSDFRPKPDTEFSIVGLHVDATPASIDEFRSLPVFRRNLEAIVHISNMLEVPLVLATQAHLFKPNMSPEEQKAAWFNREFCLEDGVYPDLPSMLKGMNAFNGATRAVAAAHEVPLIDLDLVVPKTLKYFRDDCHYTVEGNQRIAEALFTNLVQAGIIDRIVDGNPSTTNHPGRPAALTDHAQASP